MDTPAAQTPIDSPFRSYQVFGLSIASAIRLPDLREIPLRGVADVRLRLGPALFPSTGAVEAEPFIDTHGGACLIRAPAGRILIADGAVVEIDPTPGAGEADMAPYVLGSALAVLCHQRGLLPLHASAVAVGEGAAAFLGASGAGKSTLAAALAKAGFPAVCDDLCAMDFDAGSPVVRPGITRLKLSADSLALVGAAPRDPDPIDASGRFALDLGVGGAGRQGGSRPLKALYSLRTGEDGPPRRLCGVEAVAAIIAGVHRRPTAAALGHSRRIFTQAVALARTCPVFDAPGARVGADPYARIEAIMASVATMV
jgi:hypothetical protein